MSGALPFSPDDGTPGAPSHSHSPTVGGPSSSSSPSSSSHRLHHLRQPHSAPSASASLHFNDSPTRPGAPLLEPIPAEAVALIDDALHGRDMRHRMDPAALRLGRIMQSTPYRLLFFVLIMVFLCLGFVEAPSTLHPTQRLNAIMPRVATLTIEFLCLVFFAVDVAFRYRHLGGKTFWKSTWSKVKLAIVVVGFANVFLCSFSPRVPRVHRLLRPMMLIAQYRNVSRIFGSLLRTVPRVVNVTILLCFHVMFFGVLAFVLFGGVEFGRCTSEGAQFKYCSTFSHDSAIPPAYGCTNYYGHLGNSMNQLFILLTTANYPDVMMPVYTCWPLASLFFIIFVAIGLYFIMNLILAVSYTSFQHQTRVSVLDTITKRVECLDRAYIRLTRRHTMDRQLFGSLMAALRPDASSEAVDIFFRALDRNGTHHLSVAEFRSLPDLVEVKFVRRPRPRRPSSWASFMSHRYTQWAFDSLVLLSGILILTQLTFHEQSTTFKRLTTVANVITTVFVVEIVAKLAAFGPVGFFRDNYNKIDALVVPAAFVAFILDACNVRIRPAVVSLLQFSRMVRLFRVLRAVPGFEYTVKTFVEIFPVFCRYLVVMFVVFYQFAIVGMEIFAGAVTFQMTELQNTAYYAGRYWPNTFDSLGKALVTLFELMVVNNWPITMEGFSDVTSYWAMLYFYLWYFSVPLFVLNLVTAFLIDDFTVINAKLEDAGAGKEIDDWKVCVQGAVEDLGSLILRTHTLERPLHIIDVYALMFADDIEEHLREMDDKNPLSSALNLTPIDNRMGSSPFIWSGGGFGAPPSPRVSHRGSAVEAAVMAAVDGVGVGGAGIPRTTSSKSSGGGHGGFPSPAMMGMRHTHFRHNPRLTRADSVLSTGSASASASDVGSDVASGGAGSGISSLRAIGLRRRSVIGGGPTNPSDQALSMLVGDAPPRRRSLASRNLDALVGPLSISRGASILSTVSERQFSGDV